MLDFKENFCLYKARDLCQLETMHDEINEGPELLVLYPFSIANFSSCFSLCCGFSN